MKGYLLKITDKVMHESRIESGSHGMPKIFATTTDLAKYASERLRPQTFGKADSRFEVEAVEVEIVEKATWKIVEQ